MVGTPESPIFMVFTVLANPRSPGTRNCIGVTKELAKMTQKGLKMTDFGAFWDPLFDPSGRYGPNMPTLAVQDMG